MPPDHYAAAVISSRTPQVRASLARMPSAIARPAPPAQRALLALPHTP